MSDLNSLPVAPEFVDYLQQNLAKTAVDCLNTLNVPEQVIDLVKSIYELGYYLNECYRAPETLTDVERRYRYPIEEVIIEAVNAMAKSGGVFEGPYTSTQRRETHTPAPTRAHAKVK